MGKPRVDPLPTPDYAQAATAQGAANEAAARTTAKLSNPNIFSPYGSQTVSYNGDTPTIEQTLNPVAQRTLDQQQQAGLTLGRTANEQASLINGLLNSPYAFNFAPQTSLPNMTDNISNGVANAGSIQRQASPSGDISMQPGPYGRPQVGVSGDLGQIQAQLGSSGDIQYSPDNVQQGVRGSLDPTGLQVQGGGNQYAGRVQSQFGPAGQIQQGLNTSNVAAAPINAGTTAQQAIMARLNPQLAQQRTSTETQLINQGLRPGGEAYNNAANLLGQQENDARSQAVLQGIGLDMSANQQGYNQALNTGQFSNAAQQQQYGQALGRGQFANDAQAQRFGQNTTGTQLNNQAQAQQFGQGLAAGQFGNDAQQQQYAQALGLQQSRNAAQAQGFGQNLAGAQFGNDAANQQLSRALALQQSMNSGQQQQYSQALGLQQAQNAAQQQQYGQNMGAFDASNAAQAQQYSQNLNNNQAQNSAQQQAFNQYLQMAQFGNTAQNQLMSQQLQQRDLPINEITSLLSGSQIQNPQFQPYQGATTQPAPYFQGTQAQDQFYQNRYNQQMAARNAATQGLYGFGGSLIGGFAGL